MTFARPGSGTGTLIGRLVFSVLIRATATANGAPACPDPPAAARNALMLSFHTSPADNNGGGTAAGEAADRNPRPVMIRPVPNRLSKVSAQATASPNRSMVTKLVEAGKAVGSAAGRLRAASAAAGVMP